MSRQQPSVSDYFNVVKRKPEAESKIKMDTVESQGQGVSVTINDNIVPAVVIRKPPPLTPIHAALMHPEVPVAAHPPSNVLPRLTPIKNSCPVPNSPSKNVFSPVKTPGSPFRSQTSFAGIGFGNGTGSPVRPAPNFAGRSVVKKLFALDDDRGIIKGQAPSSPLPAYQRYAHLVATEGEAEMLYATTLPLPCKYKVLLEVFRAIETVVSLFYARSEPITLTTLKAKVRDLMPKPLLQSIHISQILTILPNSYDLKWVQSELVLTPSFDVASDSSQAMNHEVLMRRRQTFLQNLIGVCYRHHDSFLASIIPPVEIPQSKRITRWHPKFALETVPDIQPAKLPLDSTRTIETSSTNPVGVSGQKLQAVKCEIIKAKETLMAIRKSKKPIVNHAVRTISKDKGKHTSIKTISKGLLERIRERERLQAIRSMTLTKQESRDRELLTSLPNYVRMIRNAVLVEKKSVVPLSVLLQRLINSQSHGCKDTEVEEHIRLIEKIVPDWLCVLSGTQGPYVKIDKDVDINGIIAQVEMLIRKSGERLFA